ncbi:MAG: hypothetical protein QM770_22285 [Tepidisphaeraceae bacterium]
MVSTRERAIAWSFLRRRLNEGASDLLQALTTQQFLRPHASLTEAMQVIAGQKHFSHNLGTEAIERTDLDPASSIGRLRKVDLIRLARHAARLTMSEQ